MKSRAFSSFTILASLGAMAACGFMASGLDATIRPQAQAAGLDVHETHASTSLLGQFRSSAAAWLWLRTDLYLHNGVEMRPMTDWEKRSGMQAHNAADDGHEQLMDESSVTTLIPSAERDFRGLFGDIERATSAYQRMEGHTHNDPVQAFPLLRLMTWVDPQFVTGWTVGASVIARDRSEAGTAKAVAFLNDGLRENPKSLAIRAELGELLASRRRDFKAAVKVLEEAREVAFAAKNLSDEDKDALQLCYRWLGLSYKQLGRHKDLRDRMAEGLRIFPDDLVLNRLLNPPPLVLTKKGEREWNQTPAPEHEEKEHVHGPGCDHDH